MATKTKLYVWEFLVGGTWISGIGKDRSSGLESARHADKLLNPCTLNQARGTITKTIQGHEVSQSYYNFLSSSQKGGQAYAIA